MLRFLVSFTYILQFISFIGKIQDSIVSDKKKFYFQKYLVNSMKHKIPKSKIALFCTFFNPLSIRIKKEEVKLPFSSTTSKGAVGLFSLLPLVVVMTGVLS